jgi:RNA polymerase sigma-70 factor (ECF subfamily)
MPRDGFPYSGSESARVADFAAPSVGTLEQKLTQWFELLREPIYFYLLVVLRSPEEAEDLTQDTFLQLYKTLQAGQSIQQPRAWLFRVAHNLALNRRKQVSHLQPALTWEEIVALLPDPSPNPEQAALRREAFRRLHAAMAFLSVQEEQCLQLRVEGFRYREIADILGVSVPSVAEYVRRAIQKLSRHTL